MRLLVKLSFNFLSFPRSQRSLSGFYVITSKNDPQKTVLYKSCAGNSWNERLKGLVLVFALEEYCVVPLWKRKKKTIRPFLISFAFFHAFLRNCFFIIATILVTGLLNPEVILEMKYNNFFFFYVGCYLKIDCRLAGVFCAYLLSAHKIVGSFRWILFLF